MLTDIPTLLRSANLPTTEPPPASSPPRTSTRISIQAPPDEPCLPRPAFLSTLLSQTAFFLPSGAASRACALASLTLLRLLLLRRSRFAFGSECIDSLWERPGGISVQVFLVSRSRGCLWDTTGSDCLDGIRLEVRICRRGPWNVATAAPNAPFAATKRRRCYGIVGQLVFKFLYLRPLVLL